ncbi:hypothetical protein ACA910_001451 [Epithemia clementina (nom. ined.)]
MTTTTTTNRKRSPSHFQNAASTTTHCSPPEEDEEPTFATTLMHDAAGDARMDLWYPHHYFDEAPPPQAAPPQPQHHSLPSPPRKRACLEQTSPITSTAFGSSRRNGFDTAFVPHPPPPQAPATSWDSLPSVSQHQHPHPQEHPHAEPFLTNTSSYRTTKSFSREIGSPQKPNATTGPSSCSSSSSSSSAWDWWKKGASSSPRKQQQQQQQQLICFICQTSLSLEQDSAGSHRSTAPTKSMTGMPRNALYKYFTPKKDSSSGQKPAAAAKQQRHTSPMSTTTTERETTNGSSVDHRRHRHECHFCQHVLCASCALTCQVCGHEFCTTCCRGTDQVQVCCWDPPGTNGGGDEGHVCYECVPQSQDIVLQVVRGSPSSSHQQQQLHWTSSNDESRMSID